MDTGAANPGGACVHAVLDARLWRSSGIGRYIREVAPRVARRLPGWRWTVCAPPGGEARAWAASWNAGYAAWGRGPYAPEDHVPLPPPAGGDVWWSPHTNLPAGVRGAVACTVHDLIPLRFRANWREGVRASVMRWYVGRLRRRARALLCVSRATAADVCRLARVDRGRITVVHQGVDERWFAPAEAFPGPYFLFVGNLKPHKNLGLLARAFARVAAALPHRLVLVGRRDGFFTGDPAARAALDALGGRVEHAGDVDDAALARWYAGATALALPSLCEGFGLTALEAMAAGCPVVASNVSSLPEVVGDAGLLVDPRDEAAWADALVRLAGDGALRARLAGAGRARARGFTWEACADATAAVLSRLA